jgi:VanZ family protein
LHAFAKYRMRYLKFYLPVLLWMVVIFMASTDVGSSRRTSRIIGPILRWFKPDISDETIRAIQTVLRKSGHVTEYAVLAALAWRARRQQLGSYREWNRREAVAIIILCFLYAITDELHQQFVSSRQGAAIDVLIDTVGAMAGLFAIWRAGRFKKLW